MLNAIQNQTEMRAADTVVAQLEARIVSGELANGQPLPVERELIEDFGTSRTVIREAISSLTMRGLIKHKPRCRPIVHKPDFETVLHVSSNTIQHLLTEPGGVKNLYESRVFIERALAREAATSATKEDIADLKTALAANAAAIKDSLEFYRTDTAFHGVLYGIPKNPIFPVIHAGYTAWLAPHWKKMLRSPDRNALNFEAHQAIFSAILERDPTAAETALATHLAAAWDHVQSTFPQEDI